MKNIKKYSYIRENSLVKDIFIVSSVSDLYKYLDFNFAPIGNMSKTICGYNLFNINIIKSNIKDIYFEDNIIKVGSGLMLSALDNIALKKNICNFNFCIFILLYINRYQSKRNCREHEKERRFHTRYQTGYAHS